MTTKPDFDLIHELDAIYTPKTRGISTADEVATIKTTLGIQHRTDIELQNIRNAVVMLYGQKAERTKDDVMKSITIMDAMSAIVQVIDTEKAKRGMPV